ncbi:MAG: nucleotide exchange factor GrpE [Oscillospiraceae bacterium]|nr:nucleotide exchange factor GrpE [Oscillospiraceae bacterium]
MAEKKKKEKTTDEVVIEDINEGIPQEAQEGVVEEPQIVVEKSELESLTEELERQKQLLLRTAAEFDNYKKRTERERLSTSEYIKAQTLKPLLPIIDNIDRAKPSDNGSADFQKGIEMIIKQLYEVSTNLGLTPIGEQGDTFDPQLHEAVMHIEDENLPQNSIAQVLQKGYKIGDTVIRPAMVQVAN